MKVDHSNQPFLFLVAGYTITKTNQLKSGVFSVAQQILKKVGFSTASTMTIQVGKDLHEVLQPSTTMNISHNQGLL